MKNIDNSLVALGTAFATEADLAAFSALTGGLVEKFNGVMGGVKDYIHSTAVHLSNAKTLMLGSPTFYSSIQKKIDRANYIALREVDIFVPPGLDVDYLTWLEALGYNQVIADAVVEDCLTPAVRYYALLVAMPENLDSKTVQRHIADIRLFRKEIEKAKKEVSQCYAKNDNTTRRRFGACFDRLADWKTAADSLTALNTRLAAHPPSELVKKVNELSEIIDRLIIGIKAKPEVYRLSGATASSLSELSLEIAQVAEFYAAHVYLMQTANGVFTDNIERLNKILI